MAELEKTGSKIASKFSDKMSELANNIDRLSVRAQDYKKSPRKSRRAYSEKEIDIGEDPILEIDPFLEEGMMITDIKGNLNLDMTDLIQEKDLIYIKQNTDLTLETDTVGMTDIQMMTDIEGMTDIEIGVGFSYCWLNLAE